MSIRASTKHRRLGERGQIVVIFAGAIIAFVALCAIVIDVSWYWSNTLRMQRAADAAALAGVVYLPGSPSNAATTALAEATKNGYTTDPVTGVTVTAQPDTKNPRRLLVTVSGPVNTYFARVIGLTSLNASRTSKADFVLPVPMGSPQNYYGVGTLKGTTVGDNSFNRDSGLDVATTEPATGTPWTASTGTTAALRISAVSSANTAFDYATVNGATQLFGGFGLNTGLNAGESISGNLTGLQVTLRGASVSATCAATRISVALSWVSSGNTWTTVTAQSGLLTTTAANTTLGSATQTTFWTGHTTWAPADISDANFRVRLTAVKGCATSGTRVRLDQLQVQAFYPTTSQSVSADPTPRLVYAPSSGPVLPSQGFWGAVITKGGNRGNGDRYSPVNNSGAGGPTNIEYDPAGYNYTVEVGSSGKVSIFDPTFCATGTNASNGSYGAGDHWIGTAGRPVTTVFSLFGINNTPLDLTDDGPPVVTSGAMFAGQVAADYSGTYGSTGIPNFTFPGVTGSGYANCATDPYHNAWWPMATGLVGGTYRLNVTTSSSGNDTTSAENGWSIWVSGGSTPRIYGGGRMVAYNNLESGAQLFYLAQIDAVHAGKTMIVTLFDPGDVTGDATLRIKSPDGNAYNDATFNYSSDNGRPSGSNVTSVLVRSGGTSYYENSVLTIEIPLPQTYGDVGLTPSGEILPGWWKIEYTVGGGNDTTTWEVSIRGNPVHLVLP